MKIMRSLFIRSFEAQMERRNEKGFLSYELKDHRLLLDLGAVGKEDRESVVGTGEDELLSGGLAIVIEQEKAKFVVQGHIIWGLSDGPQILGSGLLGTFGSACSAKHEPLHLFRVVQLGSERRTLDAVSHFECNACAIMVGQSEKFFTIGLRKGFGVVRRHFHPRSKSADNLLECGEGKEVVAGRSKMYVVVEQFSADHAVVALCCELRFGIEKCGSAPRTGGHISNNLIDTRISAESKCV